jgi:hypothetical protein
MTNIQVRIVTPYEGRTGIVHVTESEWASISFVDYIEIDQHGDILPEFIDAYLPTVLDAMQLIVDRAGLVILQGTR